MLSSRSMNDKQVKVLIYIGTIIIKLLIVQHSRGKRRRAVFVLEEKLETGQASFLAYVRQTTLEDRTKFLILYLNHHQVQ